MTHYHLFFFFVAGFKPKHLKHMGFNEATVYRAHANYRKAQKKAQEHIKRIQSLSLKQERMLNNPDDLT